jgi:hypothetical protein
MCSYAGGVYDRTPSAAACTARDRPSLLRFPRHSRSVVRDVAQYLRVGGGHQKSGIFERVPCGYLAQVPADFQKLFLPPAQTIPR